jgi:WD40 repeat protein
LVLGVIVSAVQAFRATAAERAARLSEQMAQDRQRDADEARNLALMRRDELAAVNQNLRRANYVADINLARVAWDESNLPQAGELLEKHRPQPGETDLRGFEWHYLRRLFHRDVLSIKAHPGRVYAVFFTADGKRLVTSGTNRSEENQFFARQAEVKLWEVATGQPLPFQLSGLADIADRAVLSLDGTRLAAPQSNHIVLVWNLATGGLVTLEGPPKLSARRACFSPDGKQLLCTYVPDNDALFKDAPRSVWIWDLARRQAVMTIDRISYLESARCFSPDGKLIATLGTSRAQVWDAATGHEAFSCKDSDGGIFYDAAFSPDGKSLAVCGSKGIRIWDVASRATRATWRSDAIASCCLVFSPDGKRLATGTAEGMAELWETAGGQKVRTFKGHFGMVRAIAFSPDGTRLATGGLDGTARLWDVTAPQDAVSIPAHALSPWELTDLSPDGQTLVTGGKKGERKPLQFWDTATGKRPVARSSFRSG